MEYLEFGDLQTYLDDSKISEPETEEIGFQILEGVNILHETGSPIEI